jgi:hypothetical protein
VLFRAFLDKLSNGWFCLFIINVVSIVFSTIISSIKKYHVLISKDVHTFFFFPMVSLEWNNNFYRRLKTTIFNAEMDNVRPLLGELLYLYFYLMELSFMYLIHISASCRSALFLALVKHRYYTTKSVVIYSS